MFSGCNNLTSVTIGASVESIGVSAFEFCISLTRIIVDENNPYYTAIDGNVYSKDGKTLILYASGKTATEFVIPDNVTSIGREAFSNCDSLTSIEIPNSVTSIGALAFYYCSNLTSVVIGNSVEIIGDGAFYNCESLTSIEIPNSVTSIGRYAFNVCISLKSIVIGDGVESIGESAFNLCVWLTSIKYRGSEEQWDAISKGSYWDYETGSYTIEYNYAG